MKASSILIVVSACVLAVSFWNRNTLPAAGEIRDELLAEPSQTPTRKRPFEVNYGGVEYRIDPQYAYDLHGMVVSYRHHDGNSRMHSRANDHLNMLDVCVVWGDNAGNPLLDRIDFWNGIFTCVVKTRDQAAWDSFDIYQLSNNHLISDDEWIRKDVRKLKIGDQIRVQGLLASYSSPGGGERGTSTTRADTGDGACETIYVDRFEIIESSFGAWRVSMYVAAVALLLGLALYFKQPHFPYK